MLEGLKNISKIPELQKRILFTFLLLAVYRIGAHVPTPGIDTAALAAFFEQAKGSLLGLFDMFAGGALSNLSVFALGIMPYISASIILQLLTVAIPHLEKLSKEGEAGRRKITQYTRYGTVVLSLIQGFGIAIGLENMAGPTGASIVINTGWAFRLMTVITLTAGTAFIMWLGEQITEKGIGNGISLIIFAGIVCRRPGGDHQYLPTARLGRDGNFLHHHSDPDDGLGRRRHRFRRERAEADPGTICKTGGRQEDVWRSDDPSSAEGQYGGRHPADLCLFDHHVSGDDRQFYSPSLDEDRWRMLMIPGRVGYELLYVAFIVFFCFFYTAVTFNPVDVADNMKKYGGYVPGIRPGKKTAEYIDDVLTKMTFGGAIYVSAVCVLPSILISSFQCAFLFRRNGLLIVVGVALDTAGQIETHLLTRQYEGFMKKGRIARRR